MTNTTMIRIWARNNNGALITALEYASMDEAAKVARDWNRGEKRPGMRVDVLANAAITAQATMVRAVY